MTMKYRVETVAVIGLIYLLAVVPTSRSQPANRELGKPFRTIENYCTWPNLTLLPDGTIIATVFNKPSHGGVPGDVECWASTDGGWTWKYRGTPAAGNETSNRMNVAAGLARNGDLLVLASGYDDPGEFKKRLPALVCRSADGGITWDIDSRPFPRDPSGKDIVPFGDIIVADDGSLRASAYLENGDMVRSDDDGRSWTFAGVIAEGHNETSPFHLGRGKWLAVSRTSDPPYPNSTLDLYTSEDDGASWSLRKRITELGQHPGHLLLLADGRIILTTGDRRPGHFGVAATISDDQGQTWSRQMRVATEASFVRRCTVGYPSCVQRPDGRIVTAYYTNEGGYHMGVVVWDLPKPASSAKTAVIYDF